jgi:hypothetical protein
MLASFLVLFAMVASVFAAEKNLRAGHAAAVEKADAHRAINALKSMGNAFAKKVANHAKKRTEMFTQARKTKALNSRAMDEPRIVRDGYMVQRSRPNADCSGVVSASYGSPIGGCTQFPGGTTSGRMACGTMGDEPKEIEVLFEMFGTPDCTGPSQGVFGGGGPPKCAFNFEDHDSKGFTSTAFQCSPKDDLPMEEKSGFLMEVKRSLFCELKLRIYYDD